MIKQSIQVDTPGYRGYILAPLVSAALVGFAIHLLVHQANIVSLNGLPLGFYLAAQAAPITLAIIAFWVASRCSRHINANALGSTPTPEISRRETILYGLKSTGEVMSGAFIVGLTGAMFALGYDGLAYPLGLMSGLVLMSLFVVPALGNNRAASLSGLMLDRYGSRTASVIAATIAITCLFLLLIAEVTAAGIVVMRLTGISYEQAIAIASLAIAVLTILASWRNILRPLLALSALAVLAALTLPVVFASLGGYASAVPQFSYGFALSDITSLERAMLENELADAVTMTSHVRPRTHFNAENFFAIAASMMFGIASLPLLGVTRLTRRATSTSNGERHQLSGQVAPIRALSWCALFVCAIVVTLPALAAFTKHSLYTTIAAGLPLADLPSWVAPYTPAGLIEVCARQVFDAPSLANACTDQEGRVRLQDLILHNDIVLLAAPEILGAPRWVSLLVLAIVATGTIVGGARLVSIITGEAAGVSDDAALNPFNPIGTSKPFSHALLFIAALLIAIGIAGACAMAARTDILTLIAWSLSLAASGLFPIIVLGNYWRGVSTTAAVAGMVSGVALAAYYIIGTTYFAPDFAQFWSAISNAPHWRLVQLSTAQDGCAQAVVSDCEAMAALSREAANWWGISTSAAATFGMPASVLAIALGSFLSPRHH